MQESETKELNLEDLLNELEEFNVENIVEDVSAEEENKSIEEEKKEEQPQIESSDFEEENEGEINIDVEQIEEKKEEQPSIERSDFEEEDEGEINIMDADVKQIEEKEEKLTIEDAMELLKIDDRSYTYYLVNEQFKYFLKRNPLQQKKYKHARFLLLQQISPPAPLMTSNSIYLQLLDVDRQMIIENLMANKNKILLSRYTLLLYLKKHPEQMQNLPKNCSLINLWKNKDELFLSQKIWKMLKTNCPRMASKLFKYIVRNPTDVSFDYQDIKFRWKQKKLLISSFFTTMGQINDAQNLILTFTRHTRSLIIFSKASLLFPINLEDLAGSYDEEKFTSTVTLKENPTEEEKRQLIYNQYNDFEIKFSKSRLYLYHKNKNTSIDCRSNGSLFFRHHTDFKSDKVNISNILQLCHEIVRDIYWKHYPIFLQCKQKLNLE